MLGSLVALSAFGLPQAIIYYLGKQKATKEVLLQHLYLFWFIFSVILGTILFVYQTYSTKHIFNNNIFYILIGLFSLKLLDYYLISFLRGIQDFKTFNLKKIAEPLLFILVLLALIFFDEPGIRLVVISYFVVSSISTIVLIFFIHTRYLNSNPNFSLSKEIITGLMRFGLKSYAQILSGHLNYQISIYMIAWMLSDVDIGLYAVAVSFASALWFFPNSLGMVLLPALSSKKDDDEINQITATVVRHTFYIVLIGILVLSLAGKYIIPIFYGQAYISSYIPMLLLLPGILAMSLYKVLTRYFTSRNLHHLTVYVGIIALVINVVSNFIFINIWGIAGGALASSFVYILSASLLMKFFLNQSSIPLGNCFRVNSNDIQIYTDVVKRMVIKLK